jgi:cyclase
MDKDGTGQGYMFELLNQLDDSVRVPIILAGGAGNWHHLLEGLEHNMIDAVATANLFNFIGEGFPNSRKQLFNSGVNLAKWEFKVLDDLKNCLSMRSKDVNLHVMSGR